MVEVDSDDTAAVIIQFSGFRRSVVVSAKAREHIDRIREAKTQAEIRWIETSDDNAAELDQLSIAQRGWKDEYLLLITTTPMVLCFVPGMVPTP
ncbi:hypothetical protein VV869_16455 [Photobacterium sp. MCCC 1A19761]|uniref:hypothetical protein n=1 Tax=Photobacterium sp. MCCC 1A19761 TaxID=3115000 RepID=UPI00307EADEF